LVTTGLVEAALTAATVHHLAERPNGDDGSTLLRALDREASARFASPPLRQASRRLGRQLVRVAARCWPAAELSLLVDLFPDGVHQCVALGGVAVAARLDAPAAAHLSVHHAVTTPAQAAVRLLGLDPFEIAAVSVRMGVLAEQVVADALHASTGPLEELPARTGPIVEIASIHHRRQDVRLFVT
jgi:urease accessory protein